MPLSRRLLIRVAGAAAVVAAGSAAGFLATRDPARAREPWHTAGTAETETRRRALSYAILAPNPHNRQPWLVRLVGEDELVLHCDTDRLLPHTDPFSRQIVIGLGCFLELLRMAAAQDGHRLETAAFPEGAADDTVDARPVARVRFVADPATVADSLFAHVLDRRTNREPFDVGRPVETAHLAALHAAAGTVAGVDAASSVSPDMVARLRDLTWRAFELEVRTPVAYRESVDLMRIGKAEIEANPDGISLGGPLFDTLKLVGMLDREQLADPASSAFRQGLDMYRAITATAMGHLWLTTAGNTRLDQIAAGAAYLRFNLAATGLGLALHPLSQVLQEYPEMADHYEEMETLLSGGRQGQRVQMLARLGYGEAAAPSPRWPVETRMRPE